MKKFWTTIKILGMAAAGGAVGGAVEVLSNRLTGGAVPITGSNIATGAAIGALTSVQGYMFPQPWATKPEPPSTTPQIDVAPTVKN